MPSEQLQKVIKIIRAKPVYADQSIEDIRNRVEEGAKAFPPKGDIETNALEVEGLPLEWVWAPNADLNNVVLYFHGGGYVIGSINSHREWVSRLSRASNARGLLFGYRLAPEFPFPAAVEDALKAYQWLLQLGYSNKRICFAGDSAGGGLVMATLQKIREERMPLPVCAACVSPWVDLTATGDSLKTKADLDPVLTPTEVKWFARTYLRKADPRSPLASPLYGDLSGLPPILIQVGTSEILFDDSIRLAKKLEQFGVSVTLRIWEEMIHIWPWWATILPEGQSAIEEMGSFLEGYWPANNRHGKP